MFLSLSWLREFVPFSGKAQDLGDRLTMLGLELEDIRRPFAEIAGIVIGEVLEREKHPDADKLSVCKVSVGSEVLDIVCGAPNVAKGQKVPVATVGAKLPGGLEIKKAKIRGQASCGMICSEREMGLSEDHSGILVLDADAPVGAKLVDYLHLNDEVLDISITPNRADCLSILGLAREVAMAYKLPLSMPKLPPVDEVPADGSSIRVPVEIIDPALCPSYLGRVILGAKVGQSPMHIRHRLQAMGVRPISNLVDITNYILMELGQPLHAFDLDKLSGPKIIVRPATEGEKFVTLDGQERTLLSTDLTIRDAEKAVALAGVMGGLNSEINDASSNVLLESAIFNPSNIRKTARRLGLHSEASYRFERGVDQVGSRFAMDRAAALMCLYSGGKLFKTEQGQEAKTWQVPAFSFRPQRARDILGVQLEENFCSDTLTSLGCTINAATTDNWQVNAPSWRHDLFREIDLIEEVGRVYGVDLVEPTLPRMAPGLDKAGANESEFSFWMRLREWACGLGLNEAINYSFVGHKDLDNFKLPADNRISIKNPLNSEQDVLRNALAPGLMNSLRVNISQFNTGVRLFELAHIFESAPSSQTTAKESGRLGILLYGERHSTAWPRGEADQDYLDLKGYVEHLLQFLKLSGADFTRLEEHSFLAPAVEVRVQGQSVGFLGQIKPDLADLYHARKAVWLAELDLETLRKLHDAAKIKFKPLPVYPAVKRDITFICPANIQVAELEKAIIAVKRPMMEEVVLVDIFEPEGKNERNLTFRLTFRHLERTLKDNEVDKERENVANSVQKALPVKV